MGLSLYVAMYAGLKFVLVLFGATDVSDRWVFELTPAFLLNRLDVQLVFLSALLAVANAYLHTSAAARDRLEGMLLSAFMAVSLVVALAAAGPDTAGANLSRLAVLLVLLAIVPADHAVLLARRRLTEPQDIWEAEGESMEDETPEGFALIDDVFRGPSRAAQKRPAPAVADWDLDDVVRSVLAPERALTDAADTELFRALEDLDALAAEAKEGLDKAPETTRALDAVGETDADLAEEALFAVEDLEAFERWVESEVQRGEGADQKKPVSLTQNGASRSTFWRKLRRLLRR
jgi:hypothetical protein